MRSLFFLSDSAQAEIKSFLERVYGVEVEKVRTANYEGKKKRGKQGFYRWAQFAVCACCRRGAGGAASGFWRCARTCALCGLCRRRGWKQGRGKL